MPFSAQSWYAFAVPVQEFAPGIPSKSTLHALPSFKQPRVFEFGVHHHLSEGPAKEHFDLRLGDPETGHAHSWALKYLPKPGERRLAVQQPTHTVGYMDFKGRIEDGYGKGQVNLLRRDRAEVLRSSPDSVRFNVYGGKDVEEYSLSRMKDRNWLIQNVTTTRASGLLPSSKPSYKEVPEHRLGIEDPKAELQAKIDGAHVLYQFKDPGSLPRVLSYRPTERLTGVIEHTHKLPDFHALRTPGALKDTILRGELYATDHAGKALPAARVGGILNAGVWKSREKQSAEGTLKPVVFDVVRWRGADVESAPYAKKREMLQQAIKAAPWLSLPRRASTPAEKRKLLEDIKTGREPSTEEGVVEWHEDRSVPGKTKFLAEQDVHVRGVFKEKGTRNLAGGFEFSRSPDGPIVGRVGTGMSHEMKKDMLAQPEKYVGLKARIQAQRAPAHYAPRAPSFLSFHLDQELPEGVKMSSAWLKGHEGDYQAFLEMVKNARVKEAKTRLVSEMERAHAAGQTGYEAELGRAQQRLGLKGRLPGQELGNVGMGAEAAVDRLVGQVPTAPTAQTEAGTYIRKMMRPYQGLAHPQDMEEYLAQRVRANQMARGLSEEAKGMTPEVYGYRKTPTGHYEMFQEDVRHGVPLSSLPHEEQLAAIQKLENTVMAPMRAKGMELMDMPYIAEGQVRGNLGNVHMVGGVPKILDPVPFEPGKVNPVAPFSTPEIAGPQGQTSAFVTSQDPGKKSARDAFQRQAREEAEAAGVARGANPAASTGRSVERMQRAAELPPERRMQALAAEQLKSQQRIGQHAKHQARVQRAEERLQREASRSPTERMRAAASSYFSRGTPRKAPIEQTEAQELGEYFKPVRKELYSRDPQVTEGIIARVQQSLGDPSVVQADKELASRHIHSFRALMGLPTTQEEAASMAKAPMPSPSAVVPRSARDEVTRQSRTMATSQISRSPARTEVTNMLPRVTAGGTHVMPAAVEATHGMPVSKLKSFGTALLKHAFVDTEQPQSSGHPYLGAALGTGLGLTGLVAASPTLRANAKSILGALKSGKINSRTLEGSAEIPAEVMAHAEQMAKHLRAAGFDPKKHSIAVGATGATGKSTTARALAKALGVTHRELDDAYSHGGLGFSGLNLPKYLREKPIGPGTVAEQNLLLNQVDPDQFFGLVHLEKPIEKIREQAIKRGRGAFQLDVTDYPQMQKAIRTAFEQAAGDTHEIAPGLRLKVRSPEGFKAQQILEAKAKELGFDPTGLSREQLVRSVALGRRATGAGDLAYVRAPRLTAGAGILAAGGLGGAQLGSGLGGDDSTKLGYKLQGHDNFQGLPIAIENKKGDVRKGVDKDGHKWRTVMKYPYGYIEGTKAKDGEGVDAYVGPKRDAADAYVVHQHKPDGTGFDEDKVMLGFDSEEAARKAYLKQYDDPKFLGPISRVPVEKLRELVKTHKKLEKISMDKTAISFLKSKNELETPREAREYLEAGDILVGKVRKPGVLARMSELSQRAPTSHVGIYVGGGRVVHSMPFKGVYNDSLNRFYADHDFTAYRVNADAKTRGEAASFAKSQVGKDYPFLATLKTLVPSSDKARDKELREKARSADAFICSALVAAAYPKHVFGNRPIESVRPIDFVRSSHTKPVAHHEYGDAA